MADHNTVHGVNLTKEKRRTVKPFQGYMTLQISEVLITSRDSLLHIMKLWDYKLFKAMIF